MAGPYSEPSSLVEIEGSGEMTFAQGKVTGTRIGEVEYAQMYDAVRFMLGSITYANGQEIIYPGEVWPGMPNMTAQSIRVKPMGKTGVTSNWSSSLAHTRARITVEYTTPSWGNATGGTSSPENNPLLIESVDYSCEILSVPIKLTDGSNSRTEKRHLRIPTITYTVEIPKFRQPSFSLLNDLDGKVNSVPILGGAIETVLFDGPKLRREITSAGDYAWNVVYKFIYNRHGWNKQIHPDTLAWVDMAALSGGNKLYETADLKQLWNQVV